MELTDDIMYQAFLEKNSDFEGIFWMAVKTTGIFADQPAMPESQNAKM